MHNFSSASYLWYVSGSKGLLGLVCFSVLFGKRITLLSAKIMFSILMVKSACFLRAPRIKNNMTNFFTIYLNSSSLLSGKFV